MPDRKQTPDVLGEILGSGAALEAPDIQSVAPRANGEPHTVLPDARKTKAPVRRPGDAASSRWEYLLVSFQHYRGWRPRYRNGQEVADWIAGPLIHDFLNEMGEAGWEVAGAAAGHPLYGSTDQHQVYFKRRKTE